MSDLNTSVNDKKLKAAEAMAEAVELRLLYEETPRDRGGQFGPKGLAHTRWICADAKARQQWKAANLTGVDK
jgi:hypothetical protein